MYKLFRSVSMFGNDNENYIENCVFLQQDDNTDSTFLFIDTCRSASFLCHGEKLSTNDFLKPTVHVPRTLLWKHMN